MKTKAVNLIFGALIILGSCAKPKAPQFLDIRNLGIEAKNIGTPVIAADVRFFNPNKFSVKMKRAEMDVLVDNHFVGHSVLDSLIDIPKLDTFSIPVKLDVDLKSVLSRSFGALLTNEVDLTFKGTAQVGKAGIYKTVPFTYQKKQRLDLFGNKGTDSTRGTLY